MMMMPGTGIASLVVFLITGTMPQIANLPGWLFVAMATVELGAIGYLVGYSIYKAAKKLNLR